jgi:hypothetical protein
MVNSDVEIALAISDGIVDIGVSRCSKTEGRFSRRCAAKKVKTKSRIMISRQRRIGLGNAIYMVGSSAAAQR